MNMILRDSIIVGTSRNSSKAYAKEVMQVVKEAPKCAKTDITMTFDDSDLERVKFPREDPLVITLIIGNTSLRESWWTMVPLLTYCITKFFKR